jgi:hypothetical protein
MASKSSVWIIPQTFGREPSVIALKQAIFDKYPVHSKQIIRLEKFPKVWKQVLLSKQLYKLWVRAVGPKRWPWK